MELISKVKVALMALFAIDDSFALDIELQFAVARLETDQSRQNQVAHQSRRPMCYFFLTLIWL